MQQILISKHASSAVHVASVTATLVFEKKHGLEHKGQTMQLGTLRASCNLL